MDTSSSPQPSAKVRLPHQSIRAGCRAEISRSERYAQTVPRMPKGRFTQNTARQSHADSRPPSTRPMNCPDSAEIWLMPSAMPRWWAGKASVRIAAELAISIEPPSAWTIRQPISHIAPATPYAGSKESATEARVKTTKPRL